MSTGVPTITNTANVQAVRTDTHGNVVTSSDPTARSDAKPSSKVMGDVKGAVHGTAGSLQAAAGATIRNKEMEEKGLEKMSEEDHRLAAKRGVQPIGSGQRHTTAPSEGA